MESSHQDKMFQVTLVLNTKTFCLGQAHTREHARALEQTKITNNPPCHKKSGSNNMMKIFS